VPIPRNQYRDCYAPVEADRNEYISVSLLDLAIIMYNMQTAAQVDEVGFQDCNRTLVTLMEELLPKRVAIPLEKVESAVWASNMLNDLKRWKTLIKDPDGSSESFDKFIIRVLRYATKDQCLVFDKDYSLIKRRRRSRRKGT
jgi:hypothetical protein